MFDTVLTSTNVYQITKPSGLNGTPTDDSKTSSWKPTGTTTNNEKLSRSSLKITSGRARGWLITSLAIEHIN